jgi:hypothetical protein
MDIPGSAAVAAMAEQTPGVADVAIRLYRV